MSSAVPQAVVLAGGRGTRIQHLLPDLPKPMAAAAGKPFLEWIVRFLARQGFTEVTISTGYRAEAIAEHFDRIELSGIQVRCVAEPEPLGTAGGFVHAVGARAGDPGPWLVCNGDSLALADLAPMLTALASGAADAAILGLRVDDGARYGSLETADDGRLLRFAEKRPGPALINAGVYLFTADLLRQFPPTRPLSFETQVFPALLETGARIAVLSTAAPFLDIGTEETLPRAGAFINANQGCFL